MNTPNPETIRKAQQRRLIEAAKARGIRVTEKKEKGK
jgi:hypothetical protein